MTTASVSIPAETNTQPRLRGFALISVMIALMLTLLLEALDQAVVGTAMPRIIASLHGLDRYSWVVTAYILASMTMIPIVGKLSDRVWSEMVFALRHRPVPAGFHAGRYLPEHGSTDSLPRCARSGIRHRHRLDCHHYGRPLPSRPASENERALWPGLWRLYPVRPNHWRLAC